MTKMSQGGLEGSFCAGQAYLAIPGPSVVPERVQRAMHRSSPDIYGAELEAMIAGIWPDLRRLAGTAHHVAAYIGNGHAAWEAALANMCSRGDRILVLISGRFGHGWAEQARQMGLEVETMDFGLSEPADPARVCQRLRAPDGGGFRAVLLTHVDTATSVRCDVAAIRGALDEAGYQGLLAVDCVASMGCEEFRMDAWGVDVAIAASQKGMMLPPGMAFVWFSQKAHDLCGQGDLASPWWRWSLRADPQEFWQRWHGTAPTHHLYGLREVLDMQLYEEGLEAVWARHATLARSIWAAFEVWGEDNPQISLNVPRAQWRSHAVTAARIGAGGASRLRAWTSRSAGLTLGVGLGMNTPADPGADDALRIAHMGHVNPLMTLGALSVMEAGLIALGVPHGAGAVSAAAAVVAQAYPG